MPRDLIPRHLAEALYIANSTMTQASLDLQGIISDLTDQTLIDKLLAIAEAIQLDAKPQLAHVITWIESKASPQVPRQASWGE